MTHLPDSRGVDSDRVDDGRRRWRALMAALLAGVIVGALAGALYGHTRAPSYEATTALSVLPDPTLNTTSQDNNPVQQDATAFIQSQLVVINGAQLATQVQHKLALPGRPDITATQVGQSYVVQIAATGGSRHEAQGIAQAAGSVYIATRTKQLVAEVKGLLASTATQLTVVHKSLAADLSSSLTAGPLTPSQTAQQTEYERLLSVRSTLTATLSQAGRTVSVLSGARVSSPALSAAAKDILAGALIGALLALILLIGVRRSVHRIRSVGDLADLDVEVLLPLQPRRSLRAVRRPDVWRSPESRLLAARLHNDVTDLRPIVLVGATPQAGTSFVATSVAAALVEHGPVLLVRPMQEPSDVAPPDELIDGPVPDVDQESDDPTDGLALLDGIATEDEPVTAAPADPELATPTSVRGVWSLPAAGRLLLDQVDPSTPRSAELLSLLARARAAGWVVVVDAAPVSRSELAVDCARAGGAVVLVVGLGKSSPTDVLVAAELFEVRRTRVVGGVLNDVPGPLRRLLARRIRSFPPADVVLANDRNGERVTVDTPPWAVRPTRGSGEHPNGWTPHPRPLPSHFSGENEALLRARHAESR